MKRKVIAVVSLLLAGSVCGGCVSVPSFDAHVNSTVKSYRFSVAGWQYRTITQQLAQGVRERDEKIESGVEEVVEYFTLVDRINTLKSQMRASSNGSVPGDSASLEAELKQLQERQAILAGTVETVIRNQAREILAKHGIFHPLDRYIKVKANFPPLNLKLEKPPYLLVISPRERIETIRTTLLRQDITVPVMEEIEAGVDGLGVSSLVVELGGLGATYPTLVTSEASLRFVLDTAAHEWLHQYLVFSPLGFRYLLDITGIARNYEIATMNETVADIVGKEVSDAAIAEYYPDNENGSQPKETAASEFDFDREMREIRKAVDQYLARGEVEAAERFMEEKRQYLVGKGYYIRKLNQAYFAFHGKYADRPAYLSPIGIELKELRAQSASLKDFLDTVAGMTSRQDLKLALKKAPR